ncbi:hypothetical protein ACD661_06675 [Legionella lytica]|uniref:Ankyrin repeats (3 copies) n=1 Tax=Legionella lytica TaxID=96232 RepID=A0ABW8D6C8_9GAMM
MPNPTFDTRFLQNNYTIAPVNQQQLLAIYNGQAPVYFEASDAPDTHAQLTAFRANISFQLFQSQYEYLLAHIKKWCRDNNVPLIRLRSDEPQGISALRLFYTRLFGPEDFFSIRAALLFGEGKKSLEELCILLQDERIPLDSKKNVLANFQEGIVVCGDGSLTNIIDVTDDLKAATGLDQAIATTKRKLLQQEILHFIQLKRFKIKPGNEIHLVNALYDLVADSYGVPKRNDNIKIPGTEKYSADLTKYLDAHLTAQSAIRFLTEQMLLALRNMNIQQTLFKGQESVEWSAGFINEAEKLIKSFNDSYSPLITLDLHSIMQSDEDGLTLTSKALNETALQVEAVKQFYQLFCKGGVVYPVIKFEDRPGTLVCYSESFIWTEEGSEIKNGTPQQFFTLFLRNTMPFTPVNVQKNPSVKRQGIGLLNELWLHYPNYKNELVHCLQDVGIDVGYLLSGTNVELIEEIIRNQLQPQEKFSFEVSLNVIRSLYKARKFDILQQLGKCGIINAYTLAENNEYELLDYLLQNDVLTQARFHQEAPYVHGSLRRNETISILAARQQFDLIGKLSDKGLISESMLLNWSSAFRNSTLRMLYAQRQVTLIGQLFRNGSLTTLQLAIDNQWEILNSLLAENAIRPEDLNHKRDAGNYYLQNTILILAINNQKDFLLSLLKHQLLKPEQFVAKAGSGFYKGHSALAILLLKEEHELIKSLLEQKAISVLKIAEQKEFSTLEKLIDRQLITAEDLNEEVKTARTTKSVLKFIVRYQKYNLLQKLAAQGVLTEAHLSMQLEPGKRLEQLLNENQQQDLVQQLNGTAVYEASEPMNVDEDYVENPPNRPKRTKGEIENTRGAAQAPSVAIKRPAPFLGFFDAPEANESSGPSSSKQRPDTPYKKR